MGSKVNSELYELLRSQLTNEIKGDLAAPVLLKLKESNRKLKIFWPSVSRTEGQNIFMSLKYASSVG